MSNIYEMVIIKMELFPVKTLDPFSYINSRFESIGNAKPGKGWNLIKNWKSADKAGTSY